jgi:predicted O-methyltransferase YrrM
MPKARAIKDRIKFSAMGRLATMPIRLQLGVPPLMRQAVRTMGWILTSREWTNFSTHYSQEGLLAMCATIAQLTGRHPEMVRGIASELIADEVFRDRILQRKRESPLRFITDPGVPLGKCLLNYVLVRASGAHRIFEAGTEQGLSSYAICRALALNKQEANTRDPEGRPMPYILVTIDLEADRGHYLEGNEQGLVVRLVGDSVAHLMAIQTPLDLFIHDTVNEEGHTQAQLSAAVKVLAPGGIIHTSWFNGTFTRCCEQAGLAYLPVSERLEGCWYGGRQAGLAIRAT